MQSFDSTKAAFDELGQKQNTLLDNGLSVIRRLKQNVLAIREALADDGQVVDDASGKVTKNVANVDAEVVELRESLTKVVAGNRRRRRMYALLFLTTFLIGVLCRLT